jgi:hypothetical protein
MRKLSAQSNAKRNEIDKWKEKPKVKHSTDRMKVAWSRDKSKGNEQCSIQKIRG